MHLSEFTIAASSYAIVLKDAVNIVFVRKDVWEATIGL